jgi:hypothetical protein
VPESSREGDFRITPIILMSTNNLIVVRFIASLLLVQIVIFINIAQNATNKLAKRDENLVKIFKNWA